MATLIPTYAAVIAGLHFCGGGHAGAMMVERLCKDYDVKHAQLVTAQEAGQEEEEEALARTVDNIVLFLAYLYALGVVACGLVYDLVRKLLAGRLLSERDAELLLLLLRHSGPQLRADDPSALKDIVLLAQVPHVLFVPS
jgi:nucleolar MIF4G domain-containing protein 1